MGAAAFLAVDRAVDRHDGLLDQIVEFQRLHQVGVPDQRTVLDADVAALGIDRVDAVAALLQLSPVRKTAASSCIAFCMAARITAVGVSPLALRKWSKRAIASSPAPLGSSWCAVMPSSDLGGLHAGRLAEHHQIDQRIGAQPIGAMHDDAGRFAHRHQAMHHRIGIAVRQRQRVAGIGARNAAHIVMHRRQHRDRLLGDIHAGEDARAFPKCRAGARE